MNHRQLNHADPVESVQSSADGKWLLTTTTYAGVTLWDVVTSTLVHTYRCPGNGANDAIFLKDNQHIFVAGVAFGESVLVDLRTGKWESTDEMIQAQCATLTPDGQSILIASWNGIQGVAQLLASDSLKLQHEYTTEMDGLLMNIAFSKERESFLALQGRYFDIVNANFDTAFLFATDTGHILKTFRGPQTIHDIIFSPEEQEVIIGCEAGLICWDRQTAEETRRYDCPHGAVTCLIADPASNLIAGGCEDGTILLWHWPDLQQVCEYRGHTKGVNHITFIPGSPLLASASSDMTARLWRVDI